MNMISNWKDYIENFKSDEKILSAYKDLREFFMEQGWSEKDLENPPYYTKKMMRNREIINGGVIDLLHELRSYFGTVDREEFQNYIMKKMEKINLKTPLSDVNYKRDNIGDEDFE